MAICLSYTTPPARGSNTGARPLSLTSSCWGGLQAKSKVGTAAYIAPEVITAQRGSNYNGNAVDVWSSGVVLHTMLAGMYPFCDPHMPNDEVRPARPQRPLVTLRQTDVRACTPCGGERRECGGTSLQLKQGRPRARSLTGGGLYRIGK